MRNAAARSNLLVPEVREVMDIRQASDYLGISPDTLYKYASEGFVPAFKLGNRWRFKRSRLDEWMDRQSDRQAAELEIDPHVRKPVRNSLTDQGFHLGPVSIAQQTTSGKKVLARNADRSSRLIYPQWDGSPSPHWAFAQTNDQGRASGAPGYSSS